MSYRRFLIGAAAGVVLLTACSDSVGPPLEPSPAPSLLTSTVGQALNVMRQAEALETYQVSFWAVRGKPRAAVVQYAAFQTSPSRGDEDGSRPRTARFLWVNVPADALSRYPDGRPVAIGDSVRITVTIDPSYVIFRFAPHGLAFNPAAPVTLHVWYGGANLDFNWNGVVDANDAWVGRTKLGLWYEPVPGAGWLNSGAAHVWDNRYFTLTVLHFSGYAVSW